MRAVCNADREVARKPAGIALDGSQRKALTDCVLVIAGHFLSWADLHELLMGIAPASRQPPSELSSSH